MPSMTGGLAAGEDPAALTRVSLHFLNQHICCSNFPGSPSIFGPTKLSTGDIVGEYDTYPPARLSAGKLHAANWRLFPFGDVRYNPRQTRGPSYE